MRLSASAPIALFAAFFGVCGVLAGLASAAQAATAPEIQRPTAAAQAVGALHTLRTVPEACVRLQGQFTGKAQQPYALSAARLSASCQPRAHFVDAAKARPAEDAGWKLNDLIRVPNAACPAQIAEIRVWRKPVGVTPKLDAQGKARVYLEDARKQALADKLASIGMFAAAVSMTGEGCTK